MTVARTETLSEESRLAAPPRRTGPDSALIAHHEHGIEVAVLRPEQPVIIGRAPTSGLGLGDRTLSREHARFTLLDGRVLVEDLGSKNGTFFGERRLGSAQLDVGDEVLLGTVRVRVQALGATGESLGIEGEEQLRRYVEEEISRAIEFHRPFAFLYVRAVDPRTCAPAASGVHPFLDVIRKRLRPVDRIGLHGPNSAHIVLPETGPDIAKNIAHALAAPLPVPDVVFLVGVVVHPSASIGVDEVIERSHRAAEKATVTSPVELFPMEAWILNGEGGAGEASQDEVVAGKRMREVLDIVGRVASSRLSVILLGETGTGKEVVARLLHEQGPRKARRMVRVNCGAIPKELVESTLFGHERGAFTGAVHQHKGVFEEADGGTVFLDEIGELPLAAQAALLRVLETGSFCRVGSTREIAVDVRVVTATHRDLEAMVDDGAFRADLYYRLGGVTIEIPCLAERVEDIAPLTRRFLRLANERNGRNVQGISPEATELLRAYGWPGNVRELRNAIERAVVVARGVLIGPEDLPTRVRGARAKAEPSAAPEAAPIRGQMLQYEAKIIRDALEACGWNRAEAAKKLEMPLRTLAYRVKVLGIKKPEG